MSCLMENYCLKVVTPSEAVLYLLKTFDFYIKKMPENIDVLETNTFR